ncbi:MAG: macro domain-containing protein [Clostridia bacterium]|nr:macro domain-containing protein [Clostridia bacterium]
MPFQIVRGDITRMEVDAIVNAANNTLLGGGGVDGAIHRAAGPELLRECRTLGGCETGGAKITGGYRLPARYVIHTVGPVWKGGGYGERELLLSCYRKSLALALERGCASVAFPLISSGVYGYPKAPALEAAEEAIGAFLGEHDMDVYLTLVGDTSFVGDDALLREVMGYIGDALDRPSGMYGDAEAMPEISAPRPIKGLRSHRRKAAEPMEEDELSPGKVNAYDAPFEASRLQGMPDWDAILKNTDEGFSQALLRLIDERGMTDAQCYKRANVDRKLFHKIRSNPGYRPGKPTVFAFAVALELSLEETREFLDKAGFSLSHSSRFDIILEYFISRGIYDIFSINEVLFRFDMPLLGSGMNI